MWPQGLNAKNAKQEMENFKWAQQVNKDIEADQRRQAALASLIAAETANATNTDDENEAPVPESDEEAAESECPDNNKQDEKVHHMPRDR